MWLILLNLNKCVTWLSTGGLANGCVQDCHTAATQKAAALVLTPSLCLIHQVLYLFISTHRQIFSAWELPWKWGRLDRKLPLSLSLCLTSLINCAHFDFNNLILLIPWRQKKRENIYPFNPPHLDFCFVFDLIGTAHTHLPFAAWAKKRQRVLFFMGREILSSHYFLGCECTTMTRVEQTPSHLQIDLLVIFYQLKYL